jgi:uncharacterized protein YegL
MTLLGLKNIITFISLLILFICGLILIALYFYQYKKTLNLKDFTINKNYLEQLVLPNTIYKSVLIFIIVFSILWIALRPANIDPNAPGIKSDLEVVFVFDTTLSMAGYDVPTPHKNRLNYAKHEIINFIKENPQHRYGVVSFTHKVFSDIAVVDSIDTVSMVIDTLTPVSGFYAHGSAVNLAIDEAVDRLNNTQSKDTTRKLIILVTDGEFSEEERPLLEESIKNIPDSNFSFFTIGVGTKEGSELPYWRDLETGELTGEARTLLGKPIISKADFAYLQKISKLQKGISFEIGNLNNLNNSINKLPLNYFDTEEMLIIYREYYFIFVPILLISFILFKFTKIKRTKYIK